MKVLSARKWATEGGGTPSNEVKAEMEVAAKVGSAPGNP